MVFSSTIFLFGLLPLVLLGMWLGPRFGQRGVFWRNLLLTAASFAFYAWGEPKWVVPLFILAWINYYWGKRMAARRDQALFWLITGAGLDLGLLLLVKYGAWLGNCGIATLAWMGIVPPEAHVFVGIPLPLGISFFTFQAVSYLIDIYRGEVEPATSYINFSCYLTMFSQLVAGPIVRYADISGDITERRDTTDMFFAGMQRFMLGLGKKILIANQVAVLADWIFLLDGGELSPLLAWIGILAYAMQIYFDFSAYSDMAIGLGLMLGFRFLENFRHPYSALSVQDFWRRWHISLSTWFRDYVYIPLGGNRVSEVRTYVNLMTVFLLCGLWHGSFLALERAGGQRLLSKIPTLGRRVYVWLAFLGGWVLFRCEDLSQAGIYYQRLLGIYDGTALSIVEFSQESAVQLGVLVVALIASVGGPANLYTRLRERAVLQSGPTAFWLETGTVCFGLGIALYCTAFVLAGSYNPFIYFRF